MFKNVSMRYSFVPLINGHMALSFQSVVFHQIYNAHDYVMTWTHFPHNCPFMLKSSIISCQDDITFHQDVMISPQDRMIFRQDDIVSRHSSTTFQDDRVSRQDGMIFHHDQIVSCQDDRTTGILECFTSIHSLFNISSSFNVDFWLYLKTKETREMVRNSCKNDTNCHIFIWWRQFHEDIINQCRYITIRLVGKIIWG